MRTLLILSIGIALSVVFVYAAGAIGRGKVVGAGFFLTIWLVFCVIDFMNGVKAGYAPVDELGIHILLLTVPALSAWLAARFLS